MVSWQNILQNYAGILSNELEARYLICKSTEVNFSKSDNMDALWKKHARALEEPRIVNKPEQSLLDLKIEIAERIFRKCHFCERRCGVDRTRHTGHCGVDKARIASEFLHIGEEEMLIPSYTIFFSGCTFNCVFCQNWDISQRICGVEVDEKIMARAIEKRKLEGALNVNWVGGEPTPNIPFILKVLRESKLSIPQIWNSNMYCSKETMIILDGVIDLYLTDFKYGNDKCGKRLSNVENYVKITRRNHLIAYKQTDVLVRHLVMPNHIECCTKPILEWIAENIPNCLVNIMPQYRPEYRANEYDDISRPITMEEFSTAIHYARDLGLNYI